MLPSNVTPTRPSATGAWTFCSNDWYNVMCTLSLFQRLFSLPAGTAVMYHETGNSTGPVKLQKFTLLKPFFEVVWGWGGVVMVVDNPISWL